MLQRVKNLKHVFVIGLVEDELPSFQSIKKGNDSVEMEAERRNCFVAITNYKVIIMKSNREE